MPTTASARRSSSKPSGRQPFAPGRPPKYSGRCRAISVADARARKAAGERPAVRLRVPVDREVGFEDLVRGRVAFHTDVIGDPVIVRADGIAAYNYAVVIDDALMHVTHVVRGEDHISNTPRQILVYEAFGWTPPAFAHLSLVLGPDHAPLSKRHGATSVAEFRAKGYLPEALANYLALIGWSPGDGDEVLPLDELARRFDLSTVGHSAGVFDEAKLAWVNRHYLKAAAPDRLVALSQPFLESAGWIDGDAVGRGADRGSATSSRRWPPRSTAWPSCPIASIWSSASTRRRRCRAPTSAPKRRRRTASAVVGAWAAALAASPRLTSRDAFRALARAGGCGHGREGQGAVPHDPPGRDRRTRRS